MHKVFEVDTSASRILAERTPKLLVHYGIEPDHIIPLPGWNNPIVRVESSGTTFALRWHKQRNRTEVQIRAELALLQVLVRSSLRTPQPLPTLTGDFLLASEGHFYDLTGWLPGTVRRGDLEPGDAHTLGLTLATLHQATSLLSLPDALPRYLEPFSVKSKKSVRSLEPYFTADEFATVHDIERWATLVFAEQIQKPGSFGIIHNDFILGNCLWQKSVVSVVDFADCGIGLYLYDLAPMLTNIDAPELQKAFLEGYTSKRPLSEEDLGFLPLMQAVRHVRACLSSIAKVQRGEPGPPLEKHLASRMGDIRALLV